MTLRERSQLLDALIEGQISESDFLRLEAGLSLDRAAREEYYRRLALTVSLETEAAAQPRPATASTPLPSPARRWLPRFPSLAAMSVALALLAGGWWGLRLWNPASQSDATSKAVAMLNRVVDTAWGKGGESPRLGAALEPGRLRLESGFAQIVFYSGARVVIEGPAELDLISQDRLVCRAGRLTAEVPPQARGFRVGTPHITVTDQGASFGLKVKGDQTELQVLKGSVNLRVGSEMTEQNVAEGSAVVVEDSRAPRAIDAKPAAFASLFDLQPRCAAAEAMRLSQWRATSHHLDTDPSLLVHFDLGDTAPLPWRLHNSGSQHSAASDATIVGCRWAEGRWPDKRALEFLGVSDRARLSVPGEFQSLTLAAWVCVKGLDRPINSLFMSDGFERGTIHWLIRHDGVLGLTVVGAGSGKHQIVASPPVVTLDKFGAWLHLAAVVDGDAKRVTLYLNGIPVTEKALKLLAPFHVGAAELGNWNANGYPDNGPATIRNFSGSMDEFCLFSRALGLGEIRALYSAGKPQPDTFAQNRP